MSFLAKRIPGQCSSLLHFRHVSKNVRPGKCVINVIKRCNYRDFWTGWLNNIFNKVDGDRIKTVGPDRACAEWLLRCGAGVRWEGLGHWLRDYNLLPGGSFEKYKITEIDATEAAVMSTGFPHLVGLKHLKKIIFHKCLYLDDPSLKHLTAVKDTLDHLQISSCGGITDEGLASLTELGNLKTLLLFDLLGVRDAESCYKLLRGALPRCDIDYVDAGHGKVSKVESNGG